MKKILLPMFFLATMEAYSQVASNDLVIGNNNKYFDVKIKKNNVFPGLINNVSTNVIRSFIDMFGCATEVNLFVNEQEATAYFICDNEAVTVRYKRDGNLISTRKVYEGSKLQPLIADFLSREIEKHFVINLVTELTMGDNTIYEISLQDQSHWCVLQIFRNDETGVLSIIGRNLFKKG